MAEESAARPLGPGFEFGVKVSSEQPDLLAQTVMTLARVSEDDARWLVETGSWDGLMSSARYLVAERMREREEPVDLTGD